MWTCEKIILSSIQFYLVVQLIFLILYWILNWQSEYQNQNIYYVVSKIIQYFIHLIFFPKLEDYQKYLKYHAILYFFMDFYGLFLIEKQIWNLWIILSQLLIGLIILSCFIIYQILFTILSYISNFFTCQQGEKLDSLLEHYLFPQFCIALISINLLLFYDYSYMDLCYLILRVCQYFITYLYLQEKDTLMNLYGLLYLNNETILFWFIIVQIVLGCFHYCLFILSLILFTISNYYILVGQYIYFRISKLAQNNESDGLITNFIRLNLITELVLTIYPVTEKQLYSELIWPEIIYFYLRIIQYSFHLFFNLSKKDLGHHYHFTFYFLMDMYGLYVLLTFNYFFWNIIFQIIFGFILYYWLLIEFISMKVLNDQLSFSIIDSPIESLIIIFLMLEMIFSILVIKYNWSDDKNYHIIRVISYGIIMIYIKLTDFFKNQHVQNYMIKLQYGMTLATLFNYIATFVMLSYGIQNFQTQNNFVNLLILTQLFVDLIIIGSLQLLCCKKDYLKNLYKLWHDNQKAEKSLRTYNLKYTLWWQELENIVKTEVDSKCAICYESLLNGSIICQLQCHLSHEFHDNCLKSWEVYNTTCPICRKNIKRQIQVSEIN